MDAAHRPIESGLLVVDGNDDHRPGGHGGNGNRPARGRGPFGRSALPGVRQLVGPADRAIEPDYRCPLMSLPLALGTRLETIPASVPYLSAPEAKLRLWQERECTMGNMPSGGPARTSVGALWCGRQR